MITNEERREVAAILASEAQAWRDTFPDYEFKPGDAAEVMQDMFEFVGLHGKVLCCDLFQRFADLIDRPTCKNLATHLVDELVCSACGERVDIAYLDSEDDYRVRYCPRCGAEVVEDD